jgi:hypothetical protein
MARDDVLMVALPPEIVAIPTVLLPSLKATVPTGVPDPGTLADRLAVKVTGWPACAEVPLLFTASRVPR